MKDAFFSRFVDHCFGLIQLFNRCFGRGLRDRKADLFYRRFCLRLDRFVSQSPNFVLFRTLECRFMVSHFVSPLI